jgi:hypothetical protein
MSMNPLNDYLPTYESDHTPPIKSRECKICNQAMNFTHYDCARVDMGDFFSPTYRWYLVELLAVLAIAAIAVLAAYFWGILAGFIALVVSAPIMYRWRTTRIENRAVWRCKHCDCYFVGPSLIVWKAS